MNLTLRIWRQKDPSVKGKMVTYKVTDVSPDMSFLEMLDVLNERLILDGDDPVAFDHDCREGICGMCGVMINGMAHGPQQTTTCQLHMRKFSGRRHDRRRAVAGQRVPGDQGPRGRPQRVRPDHPGRRLHQRPDRDGARRARGAGAEEGLRRRVRRRDLHRLRRLRRGVSQRVVDAVHRREGHPPRADAAGQPERDDRVVNMVHQQDLEGFGGCTNIGECSASCPKGISMETISRLNHDLLGALRAGVRPKS